MDYPKLYEGFPGVKIRGGISYFLWDREHNGPCTVQTIWDGLVAEGYSFSRRGALSEGVIRIACAFDTRSEDVDALLAIAHRYAATRQGADRQAPAMR